MKVRDLLRIIEDGIDVYVYSGDDIHDPNSFVEVLYKDDLDCFDVVTDDFCYKIFNSDIKELTAVNKWSFKVLIDY